MKKIMLIPNYAIENLKIIKSYKIAYIKLGK